MARHDGVASRLVLLAPTVRPALRCGLGFLRALPGPAGSRDRAGGRRRIRLLGEVHDRLGDEPSLRLLNVASYAFAGVPRALNTARFAVHEEIERSLPRITVPTLVVRAERDPMSSQSWARDLVALLPDGHLVRLPGHGHTAFYLDPEVVADAVGPFLAAAS